MTFYEAAIEVLREAGRPLHYKKITELARQRNLLSHVGKVPENVMKARLLQEIRKPVDQTVLRAAGPDIYALKEGVDVSDARETISLRPTVAPEEVLVVAAVAAEPTRAPKPTRAAAPQVADAPDATAHDEDDTAAAADDERDEANGLAEAAEAAEAAEGADEGAEGDGDADGDGDGEGDDGARGRRRRRGRRGGRGRRQDVLATEAPAVVSEDVPAVVAPAPAAAEAPAQQAFVAVAQARVDQRAAKSEANRAAKAAAVEAAAPAPVATPVTAAPVAAAPPAPPALVAAAAVSPSNPTPSSEYRLDEAGLHGVGDLARAVAEILAARRDRTHSLRGIATDLTARGVGSLGKVGRSVLRAELTHANQQRARAGRPPLFEELRPDVYTLAVASGMELASSYAALDTWQSAHRRVLGRTLVDRVRGLGPEALGSVVTLLLDRMGYRSLKAHEAITNELLTLSALAPRGLTSARIAVRVLPADQQVGRAHVIALRGSLHAYGATEGALISLAGVDPAAAREADVPNLAPISLLGPEELIQHLLNYGVGVQTFTVDVSCIDEGLFRDLHVHG